MAERILIVDDDKDYLLAAKLTLEAESYVVATATDTNEASAELKTSRPDLILLDVMMPGQDGFTFCDELKESPEYAGIPIVLVTAVAENPGMMMHAFEKDLGLSAEDVLPKTAAQKDLAGAVRRGLGKGQ